jgi:L-threonylcarbamoyladenylate synthase
MDGIVSTRFDCGDAEQRSAGLAEAAAALIDGGLAVFPTDTVYGLGADAFNSGAVDSLQAARDGNRNMPPSVLVGTVGAAAALTESLGAFGQDLIDEFWPGPLTLLFRASSTLMWDLGDTKGTVAIRMPLQPVALDLLRRTGPLAVSSAGRRGQPAATTVAEAEAQLGASVSVYLDAGTCADNVPSTILDLTGTVPRVLRAGALTVDAIRKVVPVIDLPGHPDDPFAGLSPADRRAAEAIAAASANTADQVNTAGPADEAPADLAPDRDPGPGD